MSTVEERSFGKAPNGIVTLRDFDEGFVKNLQAVLGHREGDTVEGYYVPLQGIQYPPGCPGIPVHFAYPEDWEDYVLPSFVVERSSISPDLPRNYPSSLQYQAPAPGATVLSETRGGVTKTGYSKVVQMPQAHPYSISYTVTVVANKRGGTGQKGSPVGMANVMLAHVLKWFPPFLGIAIFDSMGDRRVYFGTQDSVDPMDDSADIRDRLIGWTISVSIEAELDLTDAQVLSVAQGVVPVLEVL